MIRCYRDSDHNALLDLLDLNIPEYFDPSERDDYISYLDNEREDYYVIERDGYILAAAGINYLADKSEARLSWDFVHPESQGKGYGRAITEHRIEHIKDQGINNIRVRTSQFAYRFYEKMGFRITEIRENYWAENYHLYDMKYFSND